MFTHSFCDSPCSNRPRRGWTLVSFALQTLALACLLLLLLLYTEELPRLASLAPLLAPPPAVLPAQQRHNLSSTVQSKLMGNSLGSSSNSPCKFPL